MTAAHELLVQVISKHQNLHDWSDCSCGQHITGDHAEHLADEIRRQLHVQLITADEQPDSARDAREAADQAAAFIRSGMKLGRRRHPLRSGGCVMSDIPLDVEPVDDFDAAAIEWLNALPADGHCPTCANTGRYLWTRASAGGEIVDRMGDCPDCAGTSTDSVMPEIWDEMRQEPHLEDRHG